MGSASSANPSEAVVPAARDSWQLARCRRRPVVGPALSRPCRAARYGAWRRTQCTAWRTPRERVPLGNNATPDSLLDLGPSCVGLWVSPFTLYSLLQSTLPSFFANAAF